MSGIDEQLEDLVCPRCGKDCLSMYLYDKGGKQLSWVDTDLHNVGGEIGFRTKTPDFDDWDSVDYILCADCQIRFPIKEMYGSYLAALMKKGTWFGCDIG